MAGNKVLTIDITNDSITIIEATASQKKQSYIHNAIIFETPEEAYEDGQIRDKDRIGAAIREQLSAKGVTNKNAIFILTSTKIVNREVIIPYVAPNKVKGIINANAPEYFPVNIEDYVVAHSVLETVIGEDGAKSLRVLVVAAPQTMVKSYYELATITGLSIKSIDYIGNSMLQLIKTQTSATMTTMVIQLGSESTVLNIVKGDTLLLQRTVPYGTNTVISEVMDSKGVDAVTAMTMLQNERMITVDFDDDPITGAFRYLINNIGRVMDYYISKNPDKPIDDVFLTGDGALIRGIDGLFKIQLNVSTRIMDSLYNVKFDESIDLKIYNPVYLIAPIGAAFAPMGFVLKEQAQKQSSQGQTMLFAGLLAAAILIAAGVAGVAVVKKNAAEKEKIDYTNKIASIQDIQQIVDDCALAQAQLQDIQTMYDGTRVSNEYMLEFINELEKKTPDNVNFQTMNSSSTKVDITAMSADYDSIARYIIELKSIDCIQNAYVTNIDTLADKETGAIAYQFTITCEYIAPNTYLEATEATETVAQ